MMLLGLRLSGSDAGVWVPRISVPSCDLLIFVDQATEQAGTSYLLCGDGVRTGRAHGRADDLDLFRDEDGVEPSDELAVSITDQEMQWVQRF